MFNWDAAGAIGEILGAIAVFASLAYLSIQIRESNRSTQASAVREILDRWDTATDQLWENPEMAGFMRKTLRGENTELTRDDAQLFAIRLSHIVQIQYSVLEMAKSGLIPDELLDRVDNVVLWLLTAPGGAAWWKATGHMQPHSEYINTLLQDRKPDRAFVDWDDNLFAVVKASQKSADELA